VGRATRHRRPLNGTETAIETTDSYRERAGRGIRARDYEAYNPNCVGGDINGGAVPLKQSVLRPAPRVNPYRTRLRGVYLCSASTPPGPGVHGMSGYLAARSALRHEFGIHTTPSLAP